MEKTHLPGFGLACLTSLCLPGVANAAFIMTIDDLSTGGVDQTITDTDNDGFITFNGAVGTFTVNVTTGISVPFVSGPQLLDLNSIDVSGGAGDLEIRLTDTDYTGSPPAFEALFGGTAAPGGDIDFELYYDDANAEFGATSLIFSDTNNQNAFSGSGSTSATVTDPFSLTIVANITHVKGGVSSFDAEIRAVPLPTAVWLFGSGLLGLVVISRRKKAA